MNFFIRHHVTCTVIILIDNLFNILMNCRSTKRRLKINKRAGFVAIYIGRCMCPFNYSISRTVLAFVNCNYWDSFRLCQNGRGTQRLFVDSIPQRSILKLFRNIFWNFELFSHPTRLTCSHLPHLSLLAVPALRGKQSSTSSSVPT